MVRTLRRRATLTARLCRRSTTVQCSGNGIDAGAFSAAEATGLSMPHVETSCFYRIKSARLH